MRENKQHADVIVISPYSTYLEEVRNGSAKFIRQLLDHTKGTRFLVLNAIGTRSEPVGVNGNVAVTAAWKNNSPLISRGVVSVVRRFPTTSVVVNFEFQAFGGLLGLIGLWLTLFYIKAILRNPIHVIFHPNVLEVDDLVKLSDHLALRTPRLSAALYSFGMKLYARLLFSLSTTVVTFEEAFRSRLTRLVRDARKIIVIPHHVYGEEKHMLQRKASHKPLRALFFGFIVPYKGLELLIEALNVIDNKLIEVIIAGGVSPTARDPGYKERIIQELSKFSNVKYVGYVDDQKVEKVFAGADLLVLPYKVLLAASGPLAWAIGTKTPFILGENLVGYTDACDFKEAMASVGVLQEDVCFSSTVEGLQSLLTKLSTDEVAYKRLAELTYRLSSTRAIDAISKRYLTVWLGTQTIK